MLLIAPKGIEINFNKFKYLTDNLLLIAPKGIEIYFDNNFEFGEVAFNRTKRNWNEILAQSTEMMAELLIAPKGIEISHNSRSVQYLFLLIAPKGIEIRWMSIYNLLTYFF